MVPGCTNDSKTSKKKEISYHGLPKDKKLSKTWIEKTKCLNPPKRESCYVCSEHFESQQIQNHLRYQGVGSVSECT